MDKKIFGVYLAKLDAPNCEAHARLELPASPWELHDAMDKVQLQENEELYLEVDDYYDFEYLAPHLDGSDISLNELNELAEQLAALDEVQGIAFEGLLSMEVRNKISINGGIITLQDLRDLAASAKTDCYHIVDAADDAALGRFYAENDFIPELDGVSDSVFKMLDFAGIGRMMRQGENGVFVGGCYVLQDGEMAAALPCSRELPEKPSYLFRITLGLHPDLDDDQTVTLTLPASAEELKKAHKQLGTDSWEGVIVIDYDGIIPQAAEFSDLPAELETFNHFAEVVEAMPSREKQIPKLNAVLSASQCSSVDQAILLAERLNHFNLDTQIKNYADLVYDELENVIGGRQAEELRQCLDIEKYGRILQQGYNAEFTEYGMVTRDDFQPMDAPWQNESEVMDMSMCSGLTSQRSSLMVREISARSSSASRMMRTITMSSPSMMRLRRLIM